MTSAGIAERLRASGFCYIDCSLQELLDAAHELQRPASELQVKGGIADPDHKEPT